VVSAENYLVEPEGRKWLRGKKGNMEQAK